MSSTRYNIFCFPHKGIRNAMNQVAHLSGKTDYSDPAALAALQGLNRELVEYLDVHAEVEDKFLMSALEERAPGSASKIAREHGTLDKLTKQLQQLLETINGETSALQGFQFYLSFTDLQSQMLAHLHLEETEILALIHAHFEDTEVIAINGKIMAAFTPENILLMFKYIIPGLSPKERAALMGVVQGKAPEAFFANLLNHVKQFLSDTEAKTLELALLPKN
ncbi:MAG: hemerythrin domain-containing protein [Reichenbachiella sp.]